MVDALTLPYRFGRGIDSPAIDANWQAIVNYANGLGVNVLDLAADGTTDDGPSVQEAIDALTTGGTVIIPPGDYLMSGFNIRNFDVTVQLMPGTRIRLTDSIRLTKSQTRLLGPRQYSRTSSEPVPFPLLLWEGAANGIAVWAYQDPVGQELNGIVIDGFEVDGGDNGYASIVGLQLSTLQWPPISGGFSFGLVSNIVCRRVFKGVVVASGMQQGYLYNLRLHNQQSPPEPGSVGLDIGPDHSAAVISVYARAGTIENFDTLVSIGGGISAPDTIQVADFSLDTFQTACLNIKRGNRIEFRENHVEGQQASSEAAIILGSTDGIAAGVNIIGNDLLESFNGGCCIKAQSWQGVAITRNHFTSRAGWTIWKNAVVGGGSATGAKYYLNHMNLSSNGVVEVDSLQGFDYIQRTPLTANDLHHPIVELARVTGRLGQALAAGDFALSAGFGTTASVGSISATDARGTFIVTSAGTGQGANPTITITFKDLTWPAAPYAIVSRNGGDQPTVVPTWTTTPTTLVITFPGTPVAGQTYTFSYVVMG